jgi:preprotein translocase subunit SecG
MLEFVLIGIHIIVCFVLIMVVLLQSGKAADLAGAFGGGGSQTALGSRGAATVLTKATSIAAIMFMITSLSLAILGSRRSGSVLEQAPAPATAPAPPAAGGSPEPGAAAPAQPAAGGEKEKAAPAAPASGQAAPSKSPAPK